MIEQLDFRVRDTSYMRVDVNVNRARKTWHVYVHANVDETRHLDLSILAFYTKYSKIPPGEAITTLFPGAVFFSTCPICLASI